MDDKKYVSRFFAGVMLVALAYAGYGELRQVTEVTETVRPLLNLTSGEVVDPATAPEVMNYNNATAKEFAEHVFGDAEVVPDLNEFLSRFTCSACGKRCLLASPRCNKGKGSQEKAIVIYQEMFPEVELFSSNGIIFSIKL